MINLKNLINFLNKKKINFFTGVPDSILKELNIYINKKNLNHTIAVNEGSAVGIAIGYYLSKKKIPAVYMQNSGLSNAINPLISISHKKVYSIPSLLIIGWRGAPGLHDEPQHLTKGLITKDLLKLLGIKFCLLEKKTDFNKLSKLIDYSEQNKTPVACLIKKETFLKTKIDQIKSKDNLIKRDFFINKLLNLTKKTKIISSTGFISRELFKQSSSKQRKKNFYVVGGMGHCSMISLGYSMFTNEKVICLDGDGSMLMHLGSIFTLGQFAKKNLKYILLNNNSHESVGGQKTFADNIDIKKISKGLCFDDYFLIKNKKNLENILKKFLKTKNKSFLEVKISNKSQNENLIRPKNFIEIKNNFMK